MKRSTSQRYKDVRKIYIYNGLEFQIKVFEIGNTNTAFHGSSLTMRYFPVISVPPTIVADAPVFHVPVVGRSCLANTRNQSPSKSQKIMVACKDTMYGITSHTNFTCNSENGVAEAAMEVPSTSVLIHHTVLCIGNTIRVS
jgi:hypothetical protein